MASAEPDHLSVHPIDRFKNNIALFHNSFGTCWNVMVTYLLMYSDETRHKILDVVLLRELDYNKWITPYEHLIIMRAIELVECAFARGTIDIVLPLSKSSPYFPYYKLKKKEVVTQIVIQFMLRINRKCNDYTKRIRDGLVAESPMDSPALRRSDSKDNEKCIQEYIYEFFDYDEQNHRGLATDHSIIYFNLLSTIFINTLYYIQPIKLNAMIKSNDFMEKVEQGDYNFSVGYMIETIGHVVCIVKYNKRWKFCDNSNIYDFNMDEFMRDFNTPGIKIVYNAYKGIIKKIPNGRGYDIVYYSSDLPEIIKKQPNRPEDTTEIVNLLRVVEHDAGKLPFREALYKLLTVRPPVKMDIIYNADTQNPLIRYIEENENGNILQLIMKGVNIDMFCTISPVSYAFSQNNIEAAILLINYGCELSNVDMNSIVEARITQIKGGQLITNELQQLYDRHGLRYDKIQKPIKFIKQYYENLSQDAKKALYTFYQKLQGESKIGLTIKTLIKLYDYMIHTNLASSVDSFRTKINLIIEEGGVYTDLFTTPAYRKYAAELALISEKNKYLKNLSYLDDIFYKKYIKYKDKYLKLKN
jgi:hypothetical protein